MVLNMPFIWAIWVQYHIHAEPLCSVPSLMNGFLCVLVLIFSFVTEQMLNGHHYLHSLRHTFIMVIICTISNPCPEANGKVKMCRYEI